MGNDYQNQMHGPALQADKAGNAAAAKFDHMTSEIPGGLDKWGLLPGGSIPLDHVFERQEFFRGEIARTLHDGPEVPFQDRESISKSGALKTQQQMLNNYIMDGQILPGAEQAYNTFAPLANMAAHSATKTDEIGNQFGINTTQAIAPILDPKHAAALHKAVVASEASGALGRGVSVSSAATDLSAKRSIFLGATHDLAAIMNRTVVTKLRGEITGATAEKKEIFEKIEKAEKIAQGIEMAGTLMAGGAGAFEAVEAHGAAGRIGGAGDAVEAGGGVLGGLVGAGMKLYYEDKLNELDNKITLASGEIRGWDLATEAGEMLAKKELLKGHALGYKNAVKAYEDAIADRRMAMATIGAQADTEVNKGKKHGAKEDNVDSAIMVWVESLMETKSLIDSAKQTGADAKQSMTNVATEVLGHRNMGWSNIEDIWGSPTTAGTRTESSAVPELQALGKMRRLTDSWLAGADVLKQRLDSAVGSANASETGAAGTMAKAGYTGAF
jgi:hypothetical protein